MRKRTTRACLLAALTILLGLGAAVLSAHVDLHPLEAEARADRIVVDKGARRLTLWSGRRVLKSYPIALGWAPTGPKQREGDGRTPEGHYVIDSRNPQSCCHLALHISYPSAEDRRAAASLGVPPGGNVMIHGVTHRLGWLGRLHPLIDWTHGCIGVSNADMDELWRAVADGTPIEIRP